MEITHRCKRHLFNGALKLNLFLWALFSQVYLYAQQCYLNIHYNNPVFDISYNVQDIKKLTFTDTEMSLHFVDNSDNSVVTYSDMRKITFSRNMSQNIIDSHDSSAEIRYLQGLDRLEVKSIENIESITIYDYMGVVQYTDMPNTDNVSLNIAGYRHGMYIVYVKTHTQWTQKKFIK